MPTDDGTTLPPADPSLIDDLAQWSPWIPFADAVPVAPRLPGVYLAREGVDGPLVYAGMAGERRGRGLQGRLTIYTRGRGAVSGLGEATFDRAVADPVWLEARLAEARAGAPMRTKLWAVAAMERADLYVRWAVTDDRASALALERAVLDALSERTLWNRLR